MFVSVFDLFKVGLGPSSSHTYGPMVCAARFAAGLKGLPVASISVTLYGSLSLTGRGHATDRAVTLGLCGKMPDSISPDESGILWQTVSSRRRIPLTAGVEVAFDPAKDILFVDKALDIHPNGMLFVAKSEDGSKLQEECWLSIGGGFVVRHEELAAGKSLDDKNLVHTPVPFPFSSAESLLSLCTEHDLSIAELMRRNEQAVRSSRAVEEGLDSIWSAMETCIERGCHVKGELPGGLHVQRRAPGLYERWSKASAEGHILLPVDWLSLCAIAVNEENAAGGRVVTSPTNGAAGVIPAVLSFHKAYDANSCTQSIRDFLLTAAAIGVLYKRNASVSAAEVGCQGEIGVASSMAAAGLAAVWGGSVLQIENAAEIAMEHHLGMTCDPVAGLVQVPCIERNAMGAVKAVSAARLALSGDERQRVSLDQVIATMYQTGQDMKDKYKETSQGGLAVNVVYC
ncbi:MAG: L-serine ammonia-lyase [Kistimonas sp.]|nr:L-serine ammonia-lyase [Kistimonas sp.]